MRQAKQKSIALFLLGIALTVQAVALSPQKAYAQYDAPPIIASDEARDAIGNVKKSTEMSVTGVIFTSIVNLLTFAANRLAYDAAVMLASGGPDDAPLIEYRSAEAYFADYGSAVAGQAVGLISENIDATNGVLSNFNLCEPSNPEILLSIKLGIRSAFRRPEPLCEFNDIKENWKGFIAEVASDTESGIFKNELILTQLKDAFDPQTQEFSVGIQLYTDILGKSLQEADIMKDKLLIQGPTKDVVDVITGNIRTPASLINNDFFRKVETKNEKQDQIMHSLLNNKEALLQIGISAASTFANTLISQMTNKLYSGFFDFDSVDADPFDVGFSSSSTREDAQKRFSSLLAVAPLEVTDYDILGQFGSCSRDNRGLYNCVVDSSFISAVARAGTGVAMTVQEAVDENLIDGGWPLIPSADAARDQDAYCYTYGFCHSNLVKLRKARIISVGWELAADSTANSENDPVTLQEVLDGYDDCNSAGERDDNHPWCKLVDPNWVLKYPETQCRALVYGQLLETSAAAVRQEECVDMPSCIAEDENGTCTGGFGYCVREKNTWNFRGDSCPAYAASCLTFEDTEGENQSFILNTVDYGSCDEGSAGCLWYATEKEDPDGDGEYSWPTESDVPAADDADDAYRSRMYLTGAVEECDEEEGGCAELYERTADMRLNAVPNPSFENDDDSDSIPDSWIFLDSSEVTYDTSGDFARSGDAAVNPGASIAYQEGLAVEQGTSYTLSYYARQEDGATGEAANVIIAFENEDNATETIDLNGLAASSGCAVASYGDNIMEVVGTPEGETYERFECTLTTPILTDAGDQLFVYVDIMAGDLWFDDIQLEQGEDASDYHTGYTDSADVVVAKVAPSYLGCTGADNDPEACDGFAQVCSETEVGCTQYSPANGDPDVFGITDDTDACPSACVGYDTFKQEATRYEPDGDFPVYFIPESADACDEASVGCDEFTKLSDETLEYFTYVRACLTTDQAAANTNGDQQATFYTWEGSDLDGYQLKTWSLLESDMDGYASITYTDSGDTENSPGAAPCTSWTTGEDGVTCNDDVLATIGKFDTDTADCDEHDDIFDNPDCREFYDEGGLIHFREWSLTVTVNDACTSYRKTDLAGLNEDSDGDGTLDNLRAEENCTESGGYFDDVLATCRYYAYGEESTTCTESAAGCREYTGGRSRNSRLVLEEQFEDGDLTAWEAASATDVTYSNESIATDGHSLSSDGESVWSYLYEHTGVCAETVDGEGCASPEDDGTLGGDCTVDDGDQYCGTLAGELYTGKTYTLSFWAKGSGDIEVGFDMGADPAAASIGSGDPSFGTVSLSASGWEEYQLGPLNVDENDYADFGDDTVLVFEPSTGVSFYVDNIVLREGEDNITVIKDSWVTPAECDEAPDGTSSPQYYLGCQEYTTQDNDTTYLKSFSSLCSEDVVGCSAYFATHESESPYAEVYGATCTNASGAIADVPTDCYKLNNGAGAFDTDSQYLCTIGVGLTSCTFDLDGYIPTSALTGTMSHLSYGPSTHVVPADTSHFLVVDSEDECAASAAGCTELGLPTFSADRESVSESTSVYLMNSPADYDEILCAHDDLFCAEWDAGEAGMYYFKDPQDQTCEYRTDVTVSGTAYDGWFRTGTSEFCYGTCVDSGQACSSDADCGGTDTCDAEVGSYVIGGDQSGIWSNGDDEYGGWVGTCSEQYSTCSEFEDVMDISEGVVYGSEDGAAYYYLDNDSLEENTLASSQQCDGKVSQKLGCALFVNATDSGRDYSASASYVASEHADVFYGDAPFALVDPIDCENDGGWVTGADGAVIDLCSQRCAYDNTAVYDLGGTYTGAYTYGGSCYTASDCTSITAESGEFVDATCVSGATSLDNDTNRVLKVNRDRQCSEWLSCSDTQTVWDAASGSFKTVCGDVSLCNEYSSDGNASFCSSWSDDSVAAVLDVDRYADRDVSWYGDDYSGYAIPDAFPVELLTQVNVAAPPGFCDMTNAYVATSGAAVDWRTSAIHGAECDTNSDCDPSGDYTGESCVSTSEPVYDLVYNAGSCDESYGVSCTVGYCQETGESCSTTDDCGADEGSCVVGTCYDVITDSDCSVDSDCTSGFSCLSGTCVDELGDLDVAYATCGETASTDYPLGGYSASVGTLTLYDSVLTKAGACVRDLCLLNADGGEYDVTDFGSKECRGYPEADSPFGSDIVEEWKNPDTTETTLLFTSDVTTDADDDGVADSIAIAPDLQPYNFVTNFEQVQTCEAGEDCLCSYSKVKFGAGAEVRYFADDTTFPDDAVGICSGGTYAGVYCSADVVDGTDTILESLCESEGGTCEYATRTDSVVGLEGYCLERDTGININGNRDDDHRACLTWLPVDQLVGSTDIYAKYLTAGYFQDSYICTDVEPYVDLLTSPQTPVDDAYSEGDIACAEGSEDFARTVDLDCVATDGSTDDGVAEWDVSQVDAHCEAVYYKTDGDTGCAQNAECPDGFWALMGSPSPDAGTNTLAEACDGDGTAEVADCPYACIPYGAYVDADPEKSCDPDSDYMQTLLDANTQQDGSVDGWDYEDELRPLDVYLVGQLGENSTLNDDDASEAQFDAMYEDLADCRAIGAEYDVVDSTTVMDFPASTGIAENATGYCVYPTTSLCDPLNSDTDCGTSGVCALSVTYGTICYPTTECSTGSECGSLGLCVTDYMDGNSATDGYRYYETEWDTYTACKEVTQVSDDSSPYKSYVWTDRVKNPGSDYAITGATSPGLAYQSSDAPAYYGMTIAYPNMREVTDPPFQVAVCKNETTAAIYLPDDPNAACPAGYVEETRSADDRATNVTDPEVRSWIDFAQTQPEAYTPGGGNRDYADIWTPLETSTMLARLNQVFAYFGFGEQYVWDGDQTSATAGNTDEDTDVLDYGDPETANDYVGLDAADTRNEGNPPTIWALDLANCEGDACEEGEENALTLNADNFGNQTATDFFRAYLKFYAAADKNQLPIRRVMVDWQDDTATGSSQTDISGSDSENNFYKNHRGLQEGSGDSLCALGSEWGLTGDSCDSAYFDYSHIYTCSAGTINSLEAAGRTCTYDDSGYATNSPCVDDNKCVFRPRVHVRDNWGWCTGVCEEGSAYDEDGTSGCFDGLQDSSDAAPYMTTYDPRSECAYLTYSSTSSSLPEDDPWVYYDGNIIVSP